MKRLTIALGAALAVPAVSAATEPTATDAAAADTAAEDAGTRYELLVVGVYRPLDLEGRTVVEPREVYLQAVGVPQGPLSTLIGRNLEVIRRAPVPAAVPLVQPAPPEAAAAPDAPAAAPSGSATAAAPSPSPAPPASTPEVARPTIEPMPMPRVPTPIGRLQVTAVRGDVVVARVVHDGVETEMHPEAEKPDGRVDLPAIMAGDTARYVEPPPPIPAPPPLTDEEKARLEAEQRRLEKDDARRKARPRPFERPVMRWKL